MKLKLDDVINIYKKEKEKALSTFIHKKYNQCIKHITTAAGIASHFNWIYKDDDLEKLLKDISFDIVGVSNEKEFIKNRCVFYDFQALDNSCLTQQYLRALISYDAEILYIPEKLSESRSKSIIKELKLYPKAYILELNDKLDYVSRIKVIYNEVASFRPEKIFLHLAPNSAMPLILFNSFPNVKKYYIDLTDHVFWLGSTSADYYIEFRNRGYSVAIEKREILKDKLLKLPYYPITGDADFMGFPKQVSSDNLVIFSGGSFYKVYDNEGVFFNIIKEIVYRFPNVIFLFAGMGIESKFSQFIHKNDLEDRVILLKFRKDISEVFKNSDIYLNTYPFSGGLMCQYAAVNGIPILAYNDDKRRSDFVESIICDDSDLKITDTSINDLLEEASKLINDENYRIKKGEVLRSSIIKPFEFNELFCRLITTHSNEKNMKIINVDYEGLIKRCLLLQNNNSYSFKSLIINEYKMRTVFMFPKLFLLTLPLLMKPRVIFDKILQRIHFRI